MKYVFFSLLLISCRPHHYGPVTISKMAMKWEKEQWKKMGIKEEDFETAAKKNRLFQFILPKKLGTGVSCKAYGKGCVGAKTAQVGLIKFVMVEYETERQAYSAALQLDQYYKYNWLFDEVVNESILEKFVSEAFEAVRAKEENIKGPTVP